MGLWLQKFQVHHDQEGIVDQSSSHHGSQESERKNAFASELFTSSPFILFSHLAFEMVPPTFTVALVLVNLSGNALRIHPDVCFINPQGASLSSQVDNED